MVLIARRHFHLIFFILIVATISCNMIIAHKRQLRILFVTGKFPYAPRWYINNQITGLLDEGHDVYILAGRVGQYPDHPEVEQYGLLKRVFYYNDFPKKFLPENLRRFDIIYAQFGTMGNRALELINNGYLHGKLVVCFRGGDATKHLKNNPNLYDELFKMACLCFPICKHFKKILIKHGCDPKKIIIHYSAINCSRFLFRAPCWPKDNVVKIISVARLVEMKGLKYAINAIELLKNVYPYIEYRIIGDGPEKDNLDALIKKKKLEKYVKLVGYVTQEKVIEELRNAHIFLHASITTEEGEQDAPANVVKEAMAIGLPFIVTRHGGLPELVKPGSFGVLVREKDVYGIYKKLLYLIKNPNKWHTMAKAGSKFVRKHFDHNRINKRLIRIFLSLVEKEKV